MPAFRLVFLFALFATVASSADSVSPILFQASFDDSLDAIGPRGVIKPAEVTGKVEFRPGKVGRALLCGGDAAQLKYPVEGNVRASQGTIEMWVQPVDWPADEQAFHIFFETGGPGWLVLYKFWSGGLLMLSGIDKEHYGSAWWEAGALKTGEWHHLAGVWDRARLGFYVDGVQRKEIACPSLPQSLAGFFNLGDAGWGKLHASHTLIDEVKIYRYALPVDQIALAAQGKPVSFRPNLPIHIEPHPARGQWRITVDASGFVAPEGPGTRASIQVLSGGKVCAEARTGEFVDSAATADLTISKVPAVKTIVRATVLDPAGKEVARSETPFEKPADAPWMNSKIGMADRVLAPFTEIKVGGIRATEGRSPAGKTVECWGRRYAMDGLLPTQIESTGQPMLARPIALSLRSSSGELPVRGVTSAIAGWSPTRAHQTASAQAGDLRLQADTTIEYDGMLWTDLTVTPTKPTELADLTLRIPMRAANAKYVHHIRPSWLEDNAGALPDAGYQVAAFQPYLWLGDDDRGLCWFAETEQGWSLAPGKPVEEVRRNGEVVEMLIHIISQPTRLTRPLKLGFGLQATPAKPFPADARSWRLGNLGTSDNLKDPSMGNLQVIWPNGNLSYYGYPSPQDPAKFRQTVADLHARNIRVIPYVNLNFCACDAPEWPYYSPDWIDSARSFTTGDVGEMGHGTYGACPHVPAWRDFIAWKLAKFIDEYGVDGIYVDCWNPIACLNEDHGCGWRDAAGNLHGRFPMRDYREIVRRVRELLQDRRPNPHIIIHMSTSVVMPMLSFADSMLDGEQYQASTFDPKDDYLGIVPLDKWRAENTGIQWGVFPFFLPEFVGKNRNDRTGTDRLMGIMLAHGASPWPIWCSAQAVFESWRAVDKFGIADAQFAPYWKPNGVTTDNPDVVVTVYRKPGRAMLVVLNAGKADATVTLNLAPKTLGLRPAFAAKMLADGAPLPLARGALKLDIPARGHKLVIVE